jgi:type IV pilus assembly protein PilP
MGNMFVILILLGISIGAHAAPVDPLSNFFRDKTKIDKPFELRDPFKAPHTKVDKTNNKAGFFVGGNGQYSNVQLATVTSIESIKIVGVLIGRERRAMVKNGGSGPIIILKEGMKIGDDGAELKAILPGGIIIVEKIVNVYGQEEYLETVIPISK